MAISTIFDLNQEIDQVIYEFTKNPKEEAGARVGRVLNMPDIKDSVQFSTEDISELMNQVALEVQRNGGS